MVPPGLAVSLRSLPAALQRPVSGAFSPIQLQALLRGGREIREPGELERPDASSRRPQLVMRGDTAAWKIDWKAVPMLDESLPST